jgi:fumarate hydratase, class I
MATIKQEDFIASIADAFQFIACYHPPSFVKAMHQAYLREKNQAARNAIAQILINSRMAATGQRPICQDTGMACVFLKIGMDVQWDAKDSLQAIIDEGVRRAYMDSHNPLRASVVSDPAGKRINTKDNTPAVVHTELVAGDKVEMTVAAKGFGSEFKSHFTFLNPSDDLVQWVVDAVPDMGAGWCPPGVFGIGIGGTADKAMQCAKEALVEEPLNIHELYERGPKNRCEELRLEIFEKVNQLGVGAQGLGGLTTVLDVKIKDYPTHASSLPVALIPNCAATRYATFTLDGNGAHQFEPPSLDTWPKIDEDYTANAQRIDLNTFNADEIKKYKAGDVVLLSGKIITGRDAAHKRLQDLIDAGKPLPENVDFTNKLIYYVGPVPKTGDEVIGPAGPTTATRMDKFVDSMLTHTGLIGMIGKAERREKAIAAIKKYQSIYLMAVGGAAYLISKAIKSSKVLAFEDLGMEAIYEFEVEDMPVVVAVDYEGNSIHESGPKTWRANIQEHPVKFYPR